MIAISSGDSADRSRNPQSAFRNLPYSITDVHIHVQPFDQLKPAALEVMRKGAGDRLEFLLALMHDPRLLLSVMDEDGIDRVGMVNYPSPDVMGFSEATNDFAARYAEADRRRLLPYGGVDPLTTLNATRSVEHLLEIGTRVLKIHPCHMRVAANAYTNGLTALSDIYRLCEASGLPVMIHTGTSIFPGARSKYGNPMEIDDVAIDFPDLRIIMAHGGRPLYMKEAFFILRRHANVWLDISGIPPKRLLEYFPRLSELSRRVLWGTDWPSPGVGRMRTNVDQFLALSLGEPLERAVLETNPKAILP